MPGQERGDVVKGASSECVNVWFSVIEEIFSLWRIPYYFGLFTIAKFGVVGIKLLWCVESNFLLFRLGMGIKTVELKLFNMAPFTHHQLFDICVAQMFGIRNLQSETLHPFLIALLLA